MLEVEPLSIYQNSYNLTSQDFVEITSLWIDPEIQQAFHRGYEFHLSDAAS